MPNRRGFCWPAGLCARPLIGRATRPELAQGLPCGPGRKTDGVERWRWADPGHRIAAHFGIRRHERSAGKLRRALDPFFTTKPAGKGTGPGLPQVHGSVKQSGGHLNIYGEAGEGATIKLYFPRDFGQESLQPRQAAFAVNATEAGSIGR
ncbi:MAG: hypothetical protein WBD78_13545 [Methylocella sp.]